MNDNGISEVAKSPKGKINLKGLIQIQCHLLIIFKHCWNYTEVEMEEKREKTLNNNASLEYFNFNGFMQKQCTNP